MANLHELCAALQSLADNSASAKVSFYYVGDDGVGLRTGGILVDHGVTAYVDHQQLPPDQAIRAIANLKLVKVATLQLVEVAPDGAQRAIELPALISGLKSAQPAAAPATPAPSARPAAAPMPTPSVMETAEAPAVQAAAHDIGLKLEATRLLEPLFGVGAAKKVDEFAIQHSPSQHPYEFLLQCQRHAAIMLGGSKAEAMFRPLYDRLESERLQRRR